MKFYRQILTGICLSVVLSLPASAAQTYGIGVAITDTDSKKAGITLDSIIDNSPAEEARLKKGDVILEINGSTIKNPYDFDKEITAFAQSMGEDIPVLMKINRGGKEFTVSSYIDVNGMSDIQRAAVIGGTSAAVGWFLAMFAGEALCFVGFVPACACVGPQC